MGGGKYGSPKRNFRNLPIWNLYLRKQIVGDSPISTEDAFYALVVVLCEFYSRKDGYHVLAEEEKIESMIKERRTVNLNEVDDLEVRELIRGYLGSGEELI